MLKPLRYKSIIIFALMFTIFALTSCAKTRDTNTQTEVEPESNIPGYYDMTQSLAGGEQSLEVNLKNLDIRTEGEDTVITLQFVQGSAAMGGQEIPLEVVPYFVTGFNPNPYRFTIHIEGLEYWDFKSKPEWDQSPLFQALLLDLSLTQQNNTVSLYFHLKKPVAFKMEEKADALEFRLRTLPDKNTTAYHVALNGYYDRSNADFPSDLALYPVLCSNRKDVILLSDPFATQAEAEAHMATVVEKLAEDYSEKTPRIIQLSPGELPVYDEKADTEAVLNKPIIKKNGQEFAQSIMAVDGRFMDWQPGTSNYLCVRPRMDEATDDMNRQWPITDELWMYQNGVAIQRLVEYEFSSVLSAKFSPDGTKLAILEMLDDLHFLYLLDVNTHKVTALSEMEFGLDTPAFAWGSDNTLYAVTGDDSYTLMAIKDGQTRVVNDDPGYTELLQWANGQLLMLPVPDDTSTSDDSTIVSVDPITGERKDIAQALGFVVNPSGTKALAWRAATDDEGSLVGWYSFNPFILDLTTGEETPILSKGISLMNALWLDDNRWCVAVEEDNDEDRYMVALYTSDDQSKAVFNVLSSELYNGQNANQLLVVDVYIAKVFYVPATYAIDLAQ